MRFPNKLSPATLALLASTAFLSACKKVEQSVSTEQKALVQPELVEREDRWTEVRVFLGSKSIKQGISNKILPENIKSVLRTDNALQYGEHVWDEKNVPDGDLQVQVDLRRQLVSVYRGGHEIGAAVILFGAEGNDTPLGRFPVKRKSREYYSRSYDDAPMPFSLWLTDDGVALHGSDVKWGAGTHGCVGVPVEFAELVFEAAETGDVVEILRSPKT